MYNKLIDIGFKTLFIYAIFVFCELCIIMVYPKVTEDLLEVSQLIQHYGEYKNPQHKQKIATYKNIANKYIDEFITRTGFNQFRPKIYVFPHSHIYGKTMELNAIAYCNVDSGNIIILTDDDFNNVFFKKDSYLAQSVMYHELGHCKT